LNFLIITLASVFLFSISVNAYAEEISKCGQGTVFDEGSNSCVLEKDIPVDESQQAIISEKVPIPNWIKSNAKWWSDGGIEDSDFTDGFAYLIHEGVVVIESELSPKTEQRIPDWVKNNGGWWADGLISDSDFMSGIEFMAKNGMIGNVPLKKSLLSDIMDIQTESNELGVKITWTNNDSKSHTVTSGNPVDGPNGIFDSSLLSPSQTSWGLIYDVGNFDYFCMVHPWESGVITVNSDDLEIYYAELEKQKAIEQQILAEQQAEILRNESVNDIKSKFISSLIETLSAEPTEKDLEDFRIFLGEERYQKLEEFNAKYETEFTPEMTSLEIDIALTLEDKFFLIELTEYWLEFFKQEMSERIMKIDNSFEEAKRQINELELSEEEKFQHIKEIEERKTAYVSGAISGMKNLILLEDEIAQKKKELQLEAELHGKSLEFGSPICGEGTIMKNGQCVPTSVLGGGCLIATATFGSELAPQVQMLREIRDNSLLQTQVGSSFMEAFNQFYYSFSPIIADYERENPIFKEVVKLTITPLLSSLSLLNYVDMDSEVEVLGYGISLILLNVGMYFVLPAIVIHRVRKFV